MRDYIKRSDVLEAFSSLQPSGFEHSMAEIVAIKTVKAVPSADVVEVVRCKDCRYATMTADGKFAKSCKIWTQARYFDADYFCADGERKEVSE